MCDKCYTWDNMKNQLFRSLFVLLPLVAFAGGEQGMHYVDRATNEFAIAYSVAFDAGCELWVGHNFVRLLPASALAVVRCRVDPANSREAR